MLFNMGTKNLKAYRSLNSITIVTMGLGMTILFFLGILSSNINKELSTSIPKNAPHYFFGNSGKRIKFIFRSNSIKLILRQNK